MNVKTLFEYFETTREWRKLSPNSQLVYKQMIKAANEKHFLITNRVSQITPKLVDDLYESLTTMGQIAHANMFMKVMRRLWNVCKRKGFVTSNPFEKMGLVKEEPRTTVWTKDQYEMYVKYTWNTNFKPLSLLARLSYVLGQRPGDMMKLTMSNFNKDITEVKFTQQKTKKKMVLPIPPELKKYIVATGGHFGFPSVRELNEQHRTVIKTLGFPPLQLRDLRRTALTEIMESGATDAEGQAISGHSDRDMLNVYSPYTLNMAKSAMAKRFGY